MSKALGVERWVVWCSKSFTTLHPLQKIRREQREQQEKELLEKRQQFREATKNLLVFVPEEQAPKEKASRGRKVKPCLSAA